MDAKEFKELILELGADFTDEELQAALAEIDEDGSAAWNGDADLVKVFIDSDSKNVVDTDIETDFGEGWTALQYAAYQGHLPVVQALVDAKGSRAMVNKGNDAGFTALFYAAQRGHVDICSFLLANDADPSLFGCCVPPTAPINIESMHENGPVSSGPSVEEKKVFMCPADFTDMYPGLRSLFADHPRCIAPVPIDTTSVKCAVSFSGILSVLLPSVQKSKNIPVKSYNVEILTKSEGTKSKSDGSKMTLSLPANPPNTSDPLTVELDKKWHQKLMNEYILANIRTLALPSADFACLWDLWNRLLSMFVLLDGPSQNTLGLAETLLTAIERGDPALREQFSSELQVVREKDAKSRKSQPSTALPPSNKELLTTLIEHLETVSYTLHSRVDPTLQPSALDTSLVTPSSVSLRLSVCNSLHTSEFSPQIPVQLVYPKFVTKSRNTTRRVSAPPEPNVATVASTKVNSARGGGDAKETSQPPVTTGNRTPRRTPSLTPPVVVAAESAPPPAAKASARPRSAVSKPSATSTNSNTLQPLESGGGTNNKPTLTPVSSKPKLAPLGGSGLEPLGGGAGTTSKNSRK
eukprot:gene24621-30989_t